MPARPRGSRRERTGKRPSSEPCLYLGCFYFDEPGEKERSGSFQIVVEAEGPEQAVERCRSRLRQLRTSTTLFDSPTTIFIEGIIRLTGVFKGGLLVNYESGEQPPTDFRLTCLVPEQADHEAESFGIESSRRAKSKGGDGEIVEPFLDFGGVTFRRVLNEARRESRGPSFGANPPAKSITPLIRPLGGAMPAKARRSKADVHAEALARKQKRQALGATMDELRATGGTSPKGKGSETKRTTRG